MASTARMPSELMPPPPPRPRPGEKHVLDEDEFSTKIEAIIERDFFPSIPKLQNQLEWLHASQSGDPSRIRQAQVNIARRRAGLATPLVGGDQTPAFMPTPGTSVFRTPAMTPLQAANNPLLERQPEQQGDASTLQLAAPKLSLDQFFERYTGEDNQAFAQILEETSQRKRAKLRHLLEDKNQPLKLEGPHPTDGYGTTGQSPSTLLMWKHTPKNNLYYASEHPPAPLSEKELTEMNKRAPKVVLHSNTRFPAEPTAKQDNQQTNADASIQKLLAQAAGTVGYDYLRTPQVPVGMDTTPLELEELLVTSKDAEGPQFRVKELRKRDLVARALAQKSTAGKQANTTPLLHHRARTPGPSTLSAAGKKLVARIASGTPNVDKQLRASYKGHGTPHRTPLGTPGITPSQRTVHKVPIAAANPTEVDKKAGESITDNLLNI